jgi:hypothetical protein
MTEPETPPAEPEAKASAAPSETVPEAVTPRRATLDAEGRERPAFLLDFPEDPDLERLITAFESGNYALVRKEAEPLASRATNEDVRRAALELRRRIEPDPLAKTLLAVSVLLLVFLTLWAYLEH